MTYFGGSSSTHRPWNYDVFLSFCGQDTRTNFTDFLFHWLVRDGIHTFKDSEELNRGEDISSELMEAIESSRIAIIVFSKNYASSTWCLDELVKILDCKKRNQIEKVIPIFYKVDPSHVRKQSNSSYAKAFKTHEKRFKKEIGKVKTWKAALTEAANISGWDQLNDANGHEAELIKKIVDEVLKTVNQTCLHVAEHPIGLNSHIEHIGSLLNDGELDVVRTIGIYGPGGIGKTTIAKAVFNNMFRNFEGSSFLANVREVSSQHNGLALLQKQLLSDVLKGKDIDTYNEDRGIIIIKERLRYKRVLIVLDDVEEMEQFCKLVGGHGWFCSGSRIILTTRDEHLLNKLEVDEKYMVKTMGQYESCQLFSHHAFQQNHPLEGYEQLSNEIVHYSGGLPLALKVLGSHLSKKIQAEWENELKKLRKIPNDKILEKLEISYNALDDFDRTIFLHISCFFIGHFKNFVIPILDACGVSGEAVIKLLIEKSLVTVDEYNRLCMHDLIRDMGREIVRKESLGKPGGRSRLWNNDDVIDVLTNLTGTNAIEGLQIKLHNHIGKVRWTTAVFSKMLNLRLLEVDCEETTTKMDLKPSHQKCFKYLVWVRWRGFPFEYMPDNFDLRNLVILYMPWSKLKEVWKGTKYLTKLKELNLSYSEHLTCTPDFTGLPNLEKLILIGCKSLVEVHKSIGRLKKLVWLDLSGCHSLKNLPRSISKLLSLKILDISYCQEIGKLPVGMGKLILSNGLCFLKEVILEGCNLTDDDIPDEFWLLCSLKSLNLGRNYFESLPSSIGQLSQLQNLKVSECKRLKSLPMLPSSLHSLDASFCFKLERLPNLSNLKQLTMLHLSCCEKLTEIEGLEGLISAKSIQLVMCHNLKSFVKKIIFQEISKDIGSNRNICDIYFDGKEIPEWFGLQSESSDSLFYQVPQLPNMEIQGLIICFICTVLPNHISYTHGSSWFRKVVVHNKSKNFTWSRTVSIPFSNERITWVIKIPSCVGFDLKAIVEYGDTIEVSFVLMGIDPSTSQFVKKIGVHFFYESSSQHEKVHFFNDVSSTSTLALISTQYENASKTSAATTPMQ